MALHAKPSGAYAEGSADWTDNINALWAFCRAQGYSEEAFAGMMGNAQHEGGMNPWRWQGDKVSYRLGYGLFQYTPASGYIQSYGPGLSYFAPNLSVTSVTSGALATDAYAQILAISASGKFFAGSTRTSLLKPYVSDCENYNTIEKFKTITSVRDATYVWMGYFECGKFWLNQTNVSSNMSGRISSANTVFQTITGTTPEEPEPDDPERPKPSTPAGILSDYYGGIRDVLRRLIIHA